MQIGLPATDFLQLSDATLFPFSPLPANSNESNEAGNKDVCNRCVHIGHGGLVL